MGVIQRGVDRKRVRPRGKKEAWLLGWKSWAGQQGPGVLGIAVVGPDGICRGLCFGRTGARFQSPGWWPSRSVGRRWWQLPKLLGTWVPALVRTLGLAQGKGSLGLHSS